MALISDRRMIYEKETSRLQEQLKALQDQVNRYCKLLTVSDIWAVVLQNFIPLILSASREKRGIFLIFPFLQKPMGVYVLKRGEYSIRVFCNFHYASITRMRRELAHFSRVLRVL